MVVEPTFLSRVSSATFGSSADQEMLVFVARARRASAQYSVGHLHGFPLVYRVTQEN